jgi:hypothetical protein
MNIKEFSIRCSLFFISSLFIFSCSIAPNHGLILTQVSYPGEFNSENDVLDKKEGIGCQVSILGLVSVGDASAGGVAREYAISKISTTDYKFTGILYPVYGRLCIFVRGE